MDEKKRTVGISELLFGLVIFLAIAGTVPLFFLDDALGENKPVVIIVSSLTFIGSFAILSIYGRSQKRKHYRRYGLKNALQDWLASSAPPGAAKTNQMPSLQTLNNIAAHLYRADNYRLDGGGDNGSLRLVNPNGQIELVKCQPGEQPVGLRDVVAFYEQLRAEKAGRGEIWSVSGFTSEAARWAKKKPINLLDSSAIHAVVEDLLVRTGIQLNL